MNIIVDKICDYVRGQNAYIVEYRDNHYALLENLYVCDSEKKALKYIKKKINEEIKEITDTEFQSIIQLKAEKMNSLNITIQEELYKNEKEYYLIKKRKLFSNI